MSAPTNFRTGAGVYVSDPPPNLIWRDRARRIWVIFLTFHLKFISVYSIPHSELEPGQLWRLRLREDIEEPLALINFHAGDDLSEFVGLAETVVAAPQQLDHREREELGEVGAVGPVFEQFPE